MLQMLGSFSLPGPQRTYLLRAPDCDAGSPGSQRLNPIILLLKRRSISVLIVSCSLINPIELYQNPILVIQPLILGCNINAWASIRTVNGLVEACGREGLKVSFVAIQSRTYWN